MKRTILKADSWKFVLLSIIVLALLSNPAWTDNSSLPGKSNYNQGPGPTLPGTPIEVAVGGEFSISLFANPNVQVHSGPVAGGGKCIWIANFSRRRMELVEQKFEEKSTSEIGKVNLDRQIYKDLSQHGMDGGPLLASGIESFRFKALKAGKTRVIMVFTVPNAEGAYTYEIEFKVTVQ